MKSNFEILLFKSLEKRFKFLDNGINLKIELIVGLIIFVMMFYVLVIIFNMLEGVGLNRVFILIVLIIFIIICSIVMVLYINCFFVFVLGLSSVVIIGIVLF